MSRMLAALLDLYFVYPYRDRHGNRVGLKLDGAVNEPDLPILVLIKDGDREYVVEVGTIDIRIITYGTFSEYLQWLKKTESQWLKDTDIVVTARGLFPFRNN